MTGGKDAQRLTVKVPPIIFRGLGILELQGAVAGDAKARSTEILPGGLSLILGDQGFVDMGVHLVGERDR